MLISVQNVISQDIKGKIITGYQGWFACEGDESPLNKWAHWSNGPNQPQTGQVGFDLYPDMREYEKTYQTGLENLGNGEPATLFASHDDQVVNKHFEWMQQYGIDCAALQRFGHSMWDKKGKPTEFKAHKDGVALKVRNAAEAYDRKFYIMWDISTWHNFQKEIKRDWKENINGSLDLISSPAYAREDGKPVVCLWGIGSAGRPGDTKSWTDVITWLQDQGCYVIAGTHKHWLSLPDVKAAAEHADMISPWFIGTYKLNMVQKYFASRIEKHMAHCKSIGVDYMPTVWPGFSWSNWKDTYEEMPNHHPRMHGGFMWEQFTTAKTKFDEAGMQATVYVAMFDEFDEATAICKAAEDSSMIPTNQFFLTLDADGVRCSSDFYLRLTQDGGKMIKGEIPITIDHPTPHTIDD